MTTLQRLATAIAVGRDSRIDYSYLQPNRRASIFVPIVFPPEPYAIPVVFGIIGYDVLQSSCRPPNPPWGEDAVVFIDLNR